MKLLSLLPSFWNAVGKFAMATQAIVNSPNNNSSLSETGISALLTVISAMFWISSSVFCCSSEVIAISFPSASGRRE